MDDIFRAGMSGMKPAWEREYGLTDTGRQISGCGRTNSDEPRVGVPSPRKNILFGPSSEGTHLASPCDVSGRIAIVTLVTHGLCYDLTIIK